MSTQFVDVFVVSATSGAAHSVTGIGVDPHQMDFDGGLEVAFVSITDCTDVFHCSGIIDG